jgi:tetratricopeptide (TPR) repeat protein
VRKQAEDAFAQIDSALNDKNYPQAMKLLSTVPADASADPKLAKRIDKIHDRVMEFAESMLASVDPLIEQKNYALAISKLRDLSDQLAGTPVGAKARQKLSDLAGDPQVRKQIDAEDRSRKADAALAEAQKLQDAKQDKAAYQRFSEITRVFSGTDAATKAKAAVEEYEKDPVFVKNVVNADRARKAAAALSMADGYKSAGLTDKAKSKYQEVIDQFPNTPQAKAAAESLQTLAGN